MTLQTWLVFVLFFRQSLDSLKRSRRSWNLGVDSSRIKCQWRRRSTVTVVTSSSKSDAIRFIYTFNWNSTLRTVSISSLIIKRARLLSQNVKYVSKFSAVVTVLTDASTAKDRHSPAIRISVTQSEVTSSRVVTHSEHPAEVHSSQESEVKNGNLWMLKSFKCFRSGTKSNT